MTSIHFPNYWTWHETINWLGEHRMLNGYWQGYDPVTGKLWDRQVWIPSHFIWG